MFKRTAVAVMLFTCSTLAAAQQPAVAWPWMPMQIWAVPVNGQAMPFPTPFWLWVAPPAAQPTVTTPPAAKAEIPAQPAATATPAAPIPAPPPAAETAAAVAPVVATPAPVPAVAATEVVKEVAKEVAKEVVAEPAAAKPAPIRMAPVAKPKLKSTRAGARSPRKLCFKDGKLDICQ